jgi:hypothetical protein
MVLRVHQQTSVPTKIFNRAHSHSHDSLDSSSGLWIVRANKRSNLTQDIDDVLLDSRENPAELGEAQIRVRVSEEISEGVQGGFSSGAGQVLHELFQVGR